MTRARAIANVMQSEDTLAAVQRRVVDIATATPRDLKALSAAHRSHANTLDVAASFAIDHDHTT